MTTLFILAGIFLGFVILFACCPLDKNKPYASKKYYND